KVRCSKCKNIFMVYSSAPLEEQDLEDNIEKQEIEAPQLKAEDLSLSDSEDLNFSEVDKTFEEEAKTEEIAESDKGELPEEEKSDSSALSGGLEMGEIASSDVLKDDGGEKSELSDSEEIDFSELEKALEEELRTEGIAESGKGEELPEEEELDFSDLSESFEKGEIASSDVLKDESGEKSELSDSEEIDFSELEKMLENGEINFDNLLSEDKGDKLKFSDTEEIDLSEIDAAIDNFEDTDIEEIEEDTKELKLDFENDIDSQILKNKAADELDFSDLETMTDFDEISDSLKRNNETDGISSGLDLELGPKDVEQKSEEDSDELDFSDLELMLDSDTGAEDSVVSPAQETAELTLEIDRPSDDNRQDLNFEDTVALDGDELDFSDLELMLDSDTIVNEPIKEFSKENFELSLETDEPSESQQHDYLSDTVVLDEIKHMGESGVNKFQETVAVGERTTNAQVTESDEIDSGKVMPSPVRKKVFGKLLLIFSITAILLLGAAAAFIYYKPLGFEIPYVSEYIESKIDKSGNLKIAPVRYSLKGDFVDTKSGTIFVITGKVINDYKHPRSNIKVEGQIFKKGRVLFGAESVYCGNVISEQDLLDNDPAVLKKRLQNRLGDNKSNISVKPGGTVPFMIIFENPSSDLDEFIVNAKSSIKG
ncbi:MAG: DUF3426 domain-containing protein, partial [Proteobacteria bacterium]|nr:DUF3426 domain-containing protein [Pseudomonadota bacterium]